MNMISAEQIAQNLPWTELIDKLEETFRLGVNAPTRHHHTVSRPDGDATMLLMPAWQETGYIGMKMLNVFPQNSAKGLAAISGLYLLSNGEDGQMLACMHGNELTRRRTAAASALASRYLSKPDASTLVIIGTGQVAPMLIEAHATTRPIKRVMIWGRNIQKAQELATSYQGYQSPFGALQQVVATDDLAFACANADIISSATLSDKPIILGEWLKPGVHLDLVGAFRKDMCEADANAVAKSQVYVDTYAGAYGEAGDLHQASQLGTFDMDNICADLAELCRQKQSARNKGDAITLFKSVGASLEDLAAAIVVWENIAAK